MEIEIINMCLFCLLFLARWICVFDFSLSILLSPKLAQYHVAGCCDYRSHRGIGTRETCEFSVKCWHPFLVVDFSASLKYDCTQSCCFSWRLEWNWIHTYYLWVYVYMNTNTPVIHPTWFREHLSQQGFWMRMIYPSVLSPCSKNWWENTRWVATCCCTSVT